MIYTKADDRMTKMKEDGLRFVRLNIRGEEWDVATDYVAPIGIGDALLMASQEGCELPTPQMVDAIWKAAEIKLSPSPMKHDGSYVGMNSPDLIRRHEEIIQEQLDSWMSGLHTAEVGNGIIAGHYKDVVIPPMGKPGLYGWHRLDGTVIQPYYAGHAYSWKDYSQGLRLCRRVP